MEISKVEQENEVVLSVKGRLDTNAAPELGDAVDEALENGAKQLVIDMADCDYVASSGLRVILGAQKKMNGLHGQLIVKNVISDVMEVFEMTGFADILTFE